jgi:hypothetical protein
VTTGPTDNVTLPQVVTTLDLSVFCTLDPQYIRDRKGGSVRRRTEPSLGRRSRLHPVATGFLDLAAGPTLITPPTPLSLIGSQSPISTSRPDCSQISKLTQIDARHIRLGADSHAIAPCTAFRTIGGN